LKDQEKKKILKVPSDLAIFLDGKVGRVISQGRKTSHCTSMSLSPRQATSCAGNGSHASIGITVSSRKSDLEVYKWPWGYTLF